MEAEKTRWTLDERFSQYEDEPHGWFLSTSLFGDTELDIFEFEIYNYNYLLDNSRSLQDIINGLRELSPLADDALDVAETMNNKDFYEFKLALAYEHRTPSVDVFRESKMPDRYLPLILPRRFILTVTLADKAEVPLGCALIRMMELEDDKSANRY